MREKRARRDGFTLVELLIVIAIIVVLMAIALPVFNRAREKTRQTACMANLHNLAMAIRMYRMDEGAYPGPYDPVTGQWGLNALYPTYVTSRETFICPDDTIRSGADYLAQLGPGVETAQYLKAHPELGYTDSLLTYEQLLTVSGQMYWCPWTEPAFFSQHYSSYNNFYNYVGYAGWPETSGGAPYVRNYTLLNYTNVSQPMIRGENLAAIFAWYRWDPMGYLQLDYTQPDPLDPSKPCWVNFECVDRHLHLDLAQQVYWSDCPSNPEGAARQVDDLGRPLWDSSETIDQAIAWNTLPNGQPSAVFPGLINRNAPDNTIVTRCPHHRAWTKTRLPRREEERAGKPGTSQSGQGLVAYTQPTETAKDLVLRLDGSVQMIPVLGGYNWAEQSSLTH